MSKHLRILSISQYGADLASGSAFSGALDRQRDYARLVAAFDVIVPGRKYTLAFHEDSLFVHTVPARTPIHFFIAAYRQAVRMHTQAPYDVLMVDTPHLSGLLGIVLRARLGVPLVVHSMADMIDNPWYGRERRLNMLKMALMSLVCYGADVVRVSTCAEVERLQAAGMAPEKIAFVPFYIDHTEFSRTLFACTQTVSEPHTLLYVGRLSPQKDVVTLIRAMQYVVRDVPEARLRIVGGGSESATVQALAAACGVTQAIDFCGPIPREDIACEFRRAGIFVLSSLYEGTCMVLHEAALAGLPIVSTDHAGAKDFVVDGKNGIVVHVRDHRGLARAIVALLKDPSMSQRMGQGSLERVQHCTKEAALVHMRALMDRFVRQV
jgi:glycosyltransferase involved in cell wall biosynthesis